MIDVVNKNGYFSVLNKVGIDVMTYYSKQDEEFCVLEEGENVPRSFVKTPYREEIELGAMHCFWVYVLGKSSRQFETNKQFMGYLIRHGLVDDYRKLEARFAFGYLQVWAADHNIVLDLDELEVI